MKPEKLKEKVDAAKEAVKDLDEPLKSKAFEIILNKLLSEEKPRKVPDVFDWAHGEPVYAPNYDEDVADKLMNTIDRTKYPIMYKLSKAVDKALYALFIVKNEYGIDGLTSSQISKILTAKFRVPTSPPAVGMALMKASRLADRIQINTVGGTGYEYRIMHEGEEHIKRILKSPPEKLVPPIYSTRKPKVNSLKSSIKSNKGLNPRLASLQNEKFFENPKEAREVISELGLKGFHYKENAVRTALLRLVKRGVLRRIRDIRGKQAIYKYCNP